MASFEFREKCSLFARAIMAILGSYLFSWGVIALGVAGTFAAGGELHDGEALSSILALLLYPAAFLWVFAARNITRAAAVPVVGALMAVSASLVQAILT